MTKPLLVLFTLVFGLCILTTSAADQTGATALTTLKQSNDRIQSFTLDNGMTLLIKEDHAAPVVSIQIWVGSGSIHEGQLMGGGLSHYVEHMVFKGTPTRKPGDIAKTIISLGGELNAYTSLDRTVFFTDIPARNWKAGLDTLADAVINASFPEEEWRREKEVILREFSMGEDNPSRQIQELLFHTAYTAHPYRLPVIGLSDIFKSITREGLLDYYHRRYVPDNMVVAVVGDLNALEAREALTKAFASFARKPNPPIFVPAEPTQTAPRQVRKAGPYKISRLMVAFHTVTLSDPDAPALELLASITGGSQSSRLVQDIKETRKLVHDISASSFTMRDPGLFVVSAELDPARETEVVEAIDSATASWEKTRFTRDEIEKARRIMLVGELAQLQTMHGQAASYAEGQLFMADPRYAEAYLTRLQAVTPADLQAVARKYLRPENRVTVILGPEKESASTLPAAMSQPSEVFKKTLSSGIPLIVREDHRLPFVYVCAAFNGGVIAETETTSGITQLMAELLTRGTPNRSASDIAATLEQLGIALSPFAGYNSFGLRGQSLAGDTPLLMDVMFDCLGQSAFPTNEIDKQKTIQLAAIESRKEQPIQVAREALDAIIFAGHPYRLPLTGKPESVASLDQTTIREYYRKQLVSGNMVLSIFGDITAKDAEALAEKYTRRIRRDLAPARLAATPKPVLPARVEAREPREQCIVLFGFPGAGLADPRRDALLLLENAMSGMSSHLFDTIRDKRGLAYYASTSQRVGLDSGLFMIYAGTRADALPEVEKLFREEIERVVTKGLDPDEIDRARNMVIAEHEMGLQDNGNLAMVCALNELYQLGFDHEFTTRKRIEAVTPDQIRQAAASILVTNQLAISIVLPNVEEKTSASPH
ncbi:MAG: pitrilysin family protein [bacterium]